MNLPEDEQGFLRDLVKTSRQRIHHINWTDRDGTARLTALTQPEATRVDDLARRLKLSRSELLRQAAHIPVARAKPPAPPTQM